MDNPSAVLKMKPNLFFLLYRSESSAVVVMSAMTTSLPRVSYNMHVTGESVEKPKEVKIR